MALKTIVTKVEYDALAEPVRALYVEKDGKFTLDVDGGIVSATELTDVKTKLAEFRDNNRILHSQVEKLQPVVDKLKNIPDLDAFLTEHKTLLAKSKELEDKGIKTVDDVKSVVEAALKPIKDQLTATEQARVDAQKRADKAMFDSLVSAEATKAGVRSSGVRHVLREAEEKFELRENRLVPRIGVKHPTDPLKELTPAEWLQDLSKSDDYLFGDSVGGGADNSNRGPRPRTDQKQLINPTAAEMGLHMDDIASGKMVVVRQ